jgi:hypothetical protein
VKVPHFWSRFHFNYLSRNVYRNFSAIPLQTLVRTYRLRCSASSDSVWIEPLYECWLNFSFCRHWTQKESVVWIWWSRSANEPLACIPLQERFADGIIVDCWQTWTPHRVQICVCYIAASRLVGCRLSNYSNLWVHLHLASTPTTEGYISWYSRDYKYGIGDTNYVDLSVEFTAWIMSSDYVPNYRCSFTLLLCTFEEYLVSPALSHQIRTHHLSCIWQLWS